MPSVILGQEQSDVLAGGQITFTRLFETFIGSGQAAPASGVTITIAAAATPGGGQGSPVPQTPSGVTSVNGSLYSYNWNVASSVAAGDYLVTWSGTGGANGSTVLTYEQYVTVAVLPLPGITPAPGVYATYGQYQAWSGDSTTPLAVAGPMLQRASEDIDRALMGAVYPVDANGLPTDALVIDVIMRATCAQAQYLIADNDPAGLKRLYVQTNVGGVSSTRTKAAQSPDMPPLAPRALQILHTYGVLPSAVLVNWLPVASLHYGKLQPWGMRNAPSSTAPNQCSRGAGAGSTTSAGRRTATRWAARRGRIFQARNGVLSRTGTTCTRCRVSVASGVFATAACLRGLTAATDTARSTYARTAQVRTVARSRSPSIGSRRRRFLAPGPRAKLSGTWTATSST